MRLFARNVIFYEKYCCAEPILENFALTTNFKVHAETCLLIICSSLGCLVFLPMVLSNFLRGCSNYENISKKWTPGWCPAKFKSVQYLAEPTAATLKGREYALQQNTGKNRKSKNKKLFRQCFGLKFMFCFLTSLCGVLAFDSVSRPPPSVPPPAPSPPAASHTQLSHTHNLLTHNLLTHNLHTF